MRLIVGISGASGVLMGYRMLQALRLQSNVEIHLIITKGAIKNFSYETDLAIEDVVKLADYSYSNKNLAASISSGSFVTDGMIVIPCSMKTLSGIANGYATNLLIRAADVCLKEGRKVVLAPREMPLGRVHLNNMQLAAESGCCIVPPMLTFYNHSDSLEAQMQHVIGKIMMQFGLQHPKFMPWQGV
jgi:4-hydroxy-3-polyprenylbenzoate decarboxylase